MLPVSFHCNDCGGAQSVLVISAVSQGLARLSGHYEETSNKLPDELIEKLVASKVTSHNAAPLVS